MNCATTCTNAGSRRGPGELPYRRPPLRRTSCKEPHPGETDQVWTEAGFLPPADYRQIVALLHRIAMGEATAAALLPCMLTGATGASRDRGYRVLDPAKFRRIAEEYGIKPAGRSDAEIAHAVTLAIIGEYDADTPEERR